MERRDLDRLADFLEKECCRFPKEGVSKEALLESNCRGDHHFTREFLKGNGFEIDSTVEWLEEHGGFCDCEVFLNVCIQ